jgi:hypothetical protein
MAAPIVDFSYFPLGGQAPLEITFVNNSTDLGAEDEWAACTLGKKYLYSSLTSDSDLFALDFSGENAINTIYDASGFRIENDGVHHPGEIITKQNVDATVDCDNDFYIEMTVSTFSNWHGSIELYFPDVVTGLFTVNPGIHLNTDGGTGVVRGINNAGDVANLANYTLPVKLKFKKEGAALYLLVNDDQVSTLAASVMGLDAGSHNLRLKMTVQNNVSDWHMTMKDIYIVNSAMPSNCEGASVEYLWDFGDGGTSAEVDPMHTFQEEDIYVVSLTATTDEGSSVLARNIFIAGESEGLENADEIFQEHIGEIVKNIDDIPNYCSNQDLRKLINVAILDAMRHADVIQDNVTARMNITVSEIYEGIRTMKCDTSFISGLHTDINQTLIRRTVVEPEKQNDIASSTFDFE